MYGLYLKTWTTLMMYGMDRLADISKSVHSITAYIPVDKELNGKYAIAAITVKTGIESVEHHLTPDCKIQFEKCEAKISKNTISDHNNEFWLIVNKTLEDENLYTKVVPTFFKVEYVTVNNGI